MKYVNQLTADDFYKLYLFMFPDERVKKKTIFIRPTLDRNYLEVTYEVYISQRKTDKVSYRFADYWTPHSIPFWNDEVKIQRLYFTYMLQHFGKSYLDDFLSFHTGMTFNEICEIPIK